jgi:hypothetical protein
MAVTHNMIGPSRDRCATFPFRRSHDRRFQLCGR